MKYRITHQTQYGYSQPVTLCHNQAYLMPRDTPMQRCLHREMTITPTPTTRSQREDFFGNQVSYFSIDHPHDSLTVNVTTDIEMAQQETVWPCEESMPWETARDLVLTTHSEENLEVRQYLYDSPLISSDDLLVAFARPLFESGRPLLSAVTELMQTIHSDFTYDPDFTTIATPLGEVLEHKRGVCQDFAHLAIGCLRAMRVPARYVSGYIETLPPPGQEKLEGADATHAWFSVFVPDIGWIDFDPTNNKMPQDQHITTAWGRDFSDVSPLKGVIFGGGDTELSVNVDVKRLPPESA